MSPVPAVTYEFDDNPPETNLIVAGEVNQNFADLVEVLKDLDKDNFGEGEGITSEIFSDALLAALGVSTDAERRGGKAIIATEEARTNTAFGVLTTPDVVEDVVLEQDGLIFATYQADWKGSVGGNAARAAFFLNDEQLKIDGTADGYGFPEIEFGPQITEATMDSDANVNTYQRLTSFVCGLIGQRHPGSTNLNPAVTTGQVVGTAVPVDRGSVYVGDSLITPGLEFYGGAVAIEAAAGTYDVGVRFKSTSGSVTAKNRKLRVWTRAFDA